MFDAISKELEQKKGNPLGIYFNSAPQLLISGTL